MQTPESHPAPWFADESTLLGELKLARGESSAGLSVPGYRITREIKRGGQGIVFEATQTSTSRRVAIKVLREWTTGADAASRRFQREVELVAQLRHPGIVRIFDSGVTSDGRAYFVMEFVEGIALDDWAKGVNREPRAVCDMLARIADSVQHAHQRGVIHRDLKPSNIRIDAEGQPRVLDFGLAKALAARGGKDAALERSLSISGSGQFLGSLPWAAPEQARGKHELTDTRTDVYALGAILYQCLSGRLPCNVDGELPAALHAITSIPPEPLCKIVPTLDLRRDRALEIICAKALAKLPEDRYASAADLASDLRHYLAGEPIAAQRESAWRGVRRRMRRYQIALIAGAIGLGLIGVFAAIAIVQRGRAIEQTAAAERERTNAETERAKAETARDQAEELRQKAEQALDVARTRTRQQDAFTSFLTSMLAAPQPGVQGKDIKMVDVLRRAADDVPRKFDKDPLTAAKMYGVLGQTFLALGDTEAAIQLHDKAIESARLTGREQTISDTEFNKAQLLTMTFGDGSAAEPVLRRVLEFRIKKWGETSDDALIASSTLATSLQLQGKSDEAIALFKKVVDGREAATPRDQRAWLIAANNYAGGLRQAGRLDEALDWYGRTLKAAMETLGPAHPNTFVAMLNRASVLSALERADEALPILREVLAGQEAALGPEHPSVAATLNQLAFAMRTAKVQNPDDGDPRSLRERALPLHERALTIQRTRVGTESRNTFVFQTSLALCLLENGDVNRSLTEARAAADGLSRTAGVTHWQTLAARGVIGRGLAAAGKTEEAITELTAAYEGLARARGKADRECLTLANALAEACERAGRLDESRIWRERAK